MGLKIFFWTCSIFGEKESKKANLITTQLEAFSWSMACMLLSSTCQHFGTDCKELISMIQDLTVWSSFLAQLKDLTVLKDRF